ncbi:hypothetical protein DFH06DRAFT_174308 [Mycena polygramma]|nr:hypothetical protein DFH06DRAFT_174308 [Mycena polygramma]
MALPSFPLHLLRSNDVPSEAEVLAIQSIIDRDYALLGNIDAHFKEYRQRVAQHAHQGLSILSISRRLPFDILAEIFFHFCKKSADVWLLGDVCKAWKAATLALPALWSIIDFGLSLPKIVVHLENSKSYPLTVYVGSSDHSAIKLLVQHSERWETATLSIRTREAEELLEPIRGRLPLLRRLKYRDRVSRARPPRLVQIAPRLLHASVATAGTVILPWVQLYSLCLQDSVDGLEFATNLVELTVHHPPYNLSKPVALPHLRKLRIGQGRLLRHLTCPVLEDLYLGSNGPMLAVPFLVRSACPLRRLTSEYEGLNASDVISILKLLPTLIELRLLCVRDVTDLLSHLTIPSNDAAFRPAASALRAIALSNINDPTTCDALIEMIASRRSSQYPILSLCVLNFEGRPQTLTSCAESTSTLLRDEHKIEVEWLAPDAAKAKMRLWELDYPYPW